MKPGAPWSVKGIKPEARTSAKEAARKSGMTLGQWLNHIIADASEGGDARLAADPQDRDVSDLHQTLGEMAARFEQSDQTLQEVSSRLSKFEDSEIPTGEGFDALSSLQESQERLLERIESIEQVAAQPRPGGDGHGLEDTIERLTTHIEQSQNQSIAGMQTIQKALGHLVGRMETVEQDKNTSAELIGTALQHITTRLEDKESNETLLLRAIDSLNKRVEQVEAQSGETGGGVKQQLESLARTIETATQTQQAGGSPQALNSALQRIALLETSFDRLTLKFEASKTEQDSTLGAIQSQLTQISNSLTTTETPAPAEPAPQEAPANRDDEVVDLDAIIEDFHNRAVGDQTDKDDQDSKPKTQVGTSPKPEPRAKESVKSDTVQRDNKATAKDETTLRTGKTVKPSRKKETKEDLPPWLRSDDEIEVQKPILQRKILLTIIGFAFIAMGAAAAFILRSDLPDLESFWNAPDRPGLGTIFGDLNSVAVETKDAGNQVEETSGNTAERGNAPISDGPAADGSPQTYLAFGSLPVEALTAEAQDGEPHAQYMLALRYFVGQDVPKDRAEANAWFEKAGAAGLAPAQYRAGVSYERGQGVEPDRSAAMTWYEAAARAGHRKAMYNLAVMHADGLGGTQDFAEAAKWFEGAANLGLLDAQFNLGIIHAQGLGGEQDLIAAYKWFAIAASSGDEEATNRLEKLTLDLTQEQIDQGRAQVANWQIPKPDLYVNFEPSS